MANQDGPSAVNFQSEQGNVEFQSETGQAGTGQAETGQAGGGFTEKVTEAAQNVNWNKVAVGAGAVAAVAGAAYAAKKFVGGSETGGSGGKND
jgi:hypothetical protein